tara:strand:- start:169 stop:417 length:249 start_codon:yes stop_codon:yes gene_type:complete
MNNLPYLGCIILSFNMYFYTYKLYKTRCNGVIKNNKQKLNQNNEQKLIEENNDEIKNIKIFLNDLETKLINIKKLTENKWIL